MCYGDFKEGAITPSGFWGPARRRLGRAFQGKRRIQTKGWSAEVKGRCKD